MFHHPYCRQNSCGFCFGLYRINRRQRNVIPFDVFQNFRYRGENRQYSEQFVRKKGVPQTGYFKILTVLLKLPVQAESNSSGIHPIFPK